MSVKYTPRNDYVLIRVEVNELYRGLAVSQSSSEGKRWFVVGVGPHVDYLNPGDEVMITGQMNINFAQVPGEATLFITQQENVLLVVNRVKEDTDGELT